MLRKRGNRALSALVVVALLAGSPAVAATTGRDRPATEAQGLWPGLETLWSWVQAVFLAGSSKGHSIDLNGASADAGIHIDPNGSSAGSDVGILIDPNG